MPETQNPTPARPRRKWLRRGGIALLVLAVVIGVATALLPTVATWQVETRLEALGARSVKVEGLFINPATGEIAVDSFKSVGPDGADISVGSTTLRISLSALIRRQITVQKLSIADADIDLRLTPTGQWSVGGFSISFADDAAPAEPDAAWQLKANNISIDNSRVSLVINKTQHRARVEKLRLDTLSTLRPGEPATLDLAASAANGSIQIDGKVFPFAAKPNIDVTVAMASIDLKTLKDLIAAGRIKNIEGVATINGKLKAAVETSGRIDADFAGTASLTGNTTATTLFATRSKDIAWKGNARISLPGTATASGAPPDIRLNGVASASNFRFENKITGMALAARSAKFDLSGPGMNMRTPSGKAPVTRVTGRLNADLSEARLDEPESGFFIAPKRISIRGDIELALPPKTAAFSARLSGTLNTEALSGSVKSAGIDAIAAAGIQLSYENAAVNISAKGGISAKATATLSLREPMLVAPEFGVTAAARRIGGRSETISFERADNGKISIAVDGTFDAAEVRAKSADGRWNTAQKKLDWTGQVSVGGPAGGGRNAGSLSVIGNASMTGLTATLNGSEAYSVVVDTALVKDIAIEGEKTGIQSASLSGVTASGETKNSPLPRLGLKSLNLTGVVSDAGTGLAIASLRASGLSGRITKLKGGSVALPSTKSDRKDTAPASPPGGATTTTPGFRIGDATLTDGRLEFIDQSIQPPFSIETSRFQGSLKNFDTANPGKDARIKLLVGLGKFGRLEAAGTLKPRFDRITADLGIGFKNVELFKFNPYIAPAIKHSVRQGRADGDIELKLRDDAIDASTSLVISRLKVKPLAPAPGGPKSGKQASAGPPIETAINFLQNDKGLMKLSIPISGSLNDPKFDISDAVGQAVAGAMQKTLMTAVKIAFPLGAVVAIVDAVGNPKFRIKPLVFTPGSARLTPLLRSRVAEIATYLKKKTDEEPSICGVATTGDLAAAQKINPKAGKADAIGIANARIRAVRDLLVSSHSISAKRLFVCDAEFSDKAAAQPTVEVGLKT
jgi:hypothetical protein